MIPKRGRWFEKAGRLIAEFGQVLVVTVVLFVLLNVVIGLAWQGRTDSNKPFTPEIPLLWTYTMDQFKKGYPDWNEKMISEFILERTRIDYRYDPFLQFVPKAQTGKYINITGDGGRKGNYPVVWPPVTSQKSVLFFGGSTAFSISVPDLDTIPARLEGLLNRKFSNLRVYNFGVPSHYSTLERIHLEQLLLNGVRPSLVIFFDGLNDFYFYEDRPAYTATLSDFVENMKEKQEQMRQTSVAELSEELAKRIPVVRFLLSKMNPKALVSKSAGQPISTDRRFSEKDIERVMSRMRSNYQVIDALGKRFGFRTLVVLQPVPTFKYDLKNHAFYQGNDESFFGGHMASRTGYRLLEQRLNTWRAGLSVLWLGNIQENRKENLYIDSVHYTVRFSDEIAQKIVKEVEGLL